MLAYDPNRDAYRILGAHPDDSAEEIDAAYRRAVKMWHPDKSPAPDAAERFHMVQQAGKILRNKRTRSDYDRLRAFHLGPEARKDRRARYTKDKRRPYTPLSAPPSWLAHRVNIHFDAVLLPLEVPNPVKKRAYFPNVLAFTCLAIALWTHHPLVATLALVFWIYGRIAAKPPHKGLMTWAKMNPSLQMAEYHALDRRAHRYDQLTVPYGNLSIEVVADRSQFQVQITGFPHDAIPVLHRTSDLGEAKRCAREAGKWLQIHNVRAA